MGLARNLRADFRKAGTQDSQPPAWARGEEGLRRKSAQDPFCYDGVEEFVSSF
jgi:hypothetical protein